MKEFICPKCGCNKILQVMESFVTFPITPTEKSYMIHGNGKNGKNYAYLKCSKCDFSVPCRKDGEDFKIFLEGE